VAKITYANAKHYLHKEKFGHVSTRICINECSFQADMYNEDCCAEACHHNKEAECEIKLYEELCIAGVHQTHMSKM